ncbi:MAG: hypothetical protein P8P74_14730 [Crocinitomicaceae bacterium]|nr:hypothetical protein [Crocinitomicaceae bacterium]
MRNILKIGSVSLVIIFATVACSTEKNTAISRNYHSLNAHYNGYFNANELIKSSIRTYQTSRQEDYYSLLPINPVPDETEVAGMYPAIDTAIVKCTKVIRDHSMPSNDRPSKKKEEHNRWIDENWTLIGEALYYRRDYEGAMKNFKFIRKFYSDDPSLFIGELWMAKTNMAKGDLTAAKFNLDNLDAAIAEQESGEQEKIVKKGTKKEVKPAQFPKKIRFDFEKTKAELALLKGEKVQAIQHLEESLNHTRLGDKEGKARVHFILGQLHEEQGNKTGAAEHFSKVIRGTSSYEMAFNARLKRTFLGEGDKVKKDLLKMLKDQKNAEFKDQIYYALADMEIRAGDVAQGKVYLHQSAFYSVNNTRQKGMAYERLGNMSFSEKNYVFAQKYYDSCGRVIADTYPNAEGIRNKAIKLSDLVVAVETAQYEDSVQRIAQLSESDRESFLKDLIKKIEKEEKARKEKEAERLLELQQNENLFAQTGTGSKWYWNNQKTRAQGYEEFRRLWGERENEDDWRRSDKVQNFISDGDPEFVDGDTSNVADVVQEDSLTVESLTVGLPLNDSLMALSNERLLEAYYNAGYLYKEQLKEESLAEENFNKVLDRNVENKHNLLSAYELYTMYKNTNPTKAEEMKSYILNNYTNSDYANYLRDPDFFIKKKERDALAEESYTRVLERYNKKLYGPVLAQADKVINEEPDNIFRSKYMLLKAMCLGQRFDDKDTLLPTLNRVMDEYPKTPEASRAQEMIDIIKNGYSENIVADFSSKSPYKYNDRVELMVVVFPDAKRSSSDVKSRISDFHREFFSRDRLKIKSKVFKDGSVIIVDEFKNESDAAKYISAYKNTRKYLLDLQNAKIMMISQENLIILLQKQDSKEYDLFYEDYY